MPERSMATDRAIAALLAGALGDAMGMPTQTLFAEEIRRHYGHVDRFVAPLPDHPVSRGLDPGTITDDTEQTLLLATVLLESQSGFDLGKWANALIEWENEVRARGGLDLLGPSTRRAIEAIRGGADPEETGRSGDTNGAAMRIAPVGIFMPPDPLEHLVAKVAQTARPTHNTSIGIASAAAVAAAISSGVAGNDWPDAAALAVQAARIGAGLGHRVTGPDVAARIGWAMELVRGKKEEEGARLIRDLVGTSVAAQQSVPAAFAVLELARGDTWQAAILAANLGGDTDTIGAIAASICGACSGLDALPAERIVELKGLDILQVRQLAARLIEVRFAQMQEIGP